MKVVRALLIISIVFLGLNLLAQKNNIKSTKIMTLEYSDGNGNYYKITMDSIIYEPVSPEMSSSGIYSGGSPRQSKISERAFNLVLAEFEAIFGNKRLHIPNRVKTSGKLVINTSETNKQAVIIKKSDEQAHLEQLLKSLLSK